MIRNLPLATDLPSRREATAGGVAASREVETPDRGLGPVFAVLTTRNVNALLESRLRDRCRYDFLATAGFCYFLISPLGNQGPSF